jgi:two-component system, cell cycle sensor histidine kinase and response regulator CckA
MTVPAVAEKIGWQSRRVRRLPPHATFYGVAVAGLAAAAITAAAASAHAPQPREWAAFALLLPLSAIAPLFTVSIGRNHGFHMGATIVVASALVLPPELVAAVAAVQYVPSFLRTRTDWFRFTFNSANNVLSALAAWAVADAIQVGDGLSFALAGVGAAVTFVCTNHVLLAVMLRLARGHSFRESGLFSPIGLGLELTIGLLGVAVAGFVELNAWLIPALVAPLLLAHRSLSTVALLRESEERFRTMFESAPTAMVLLNTDGSIIAANRSLVAMLGYGEEELRGRKPLGELVHPDDHGEGARLWAELAAGERDEYRREARFVSRSGETVVTHLAAALVRDANGKPDYVIGMAEDVTQRHILEEQLRQSQKLEAIGRLAGGVAHDFNNMLTAISGYTSFALDQAEEGTTLRSDLDEIRKATERATQLTRQLLAFSRKQVLEPVPLDLNEVVQDMNAMLRPLLGADVTLTTELDPGLGVIEADPSQLNQVLMNLVVNARDAMPGGGAVTISTANVDVPRGGDGAIEPGPYVTLTVSDEGEGIDEATLSQIFEPFFTTKESGKGTGLGLATVYGIVKQSGGYLEVESEVDVGSEFRIYLRRVDSERELEPAVAAPPANGAVARTDPVSVLVVEDEDVVRSLVVQVLEGEGYQALVARDGQDALALAGENHVDLLLTDLTMPKLGGRELAEQLRVRHPELKVVYMSGYAEGGILSDGVLPPATAFLSKPFTFTELAEKVRGLL